MAIALTPAIIRLSLLHHSVDPTCNYSNLIWYSFGLRESGRLSLLVRLVQRSPRLCKHNGIEFSLINGSIPCMHTNRDVTITR